MTRCRAGARARLPIARLPVAPARLPIARLPIAIARLPVALAALLAVLLVAGCAGIPRSSSVQDIRTVADHTGKVIPPGPKPGQQPEQVVREFIHASAQTEYDPAGESFAVARKYLTPAAAKSWHADSGSSPVVVLAGAFGASEDADHPGWVTVQGTQVGLLNPDRSYRPVANAPYSVRMHLDESGGRWLISDPPSSVLITQDDFLTAFRQRTVYFLDASGRVVVPDIRYIPSASTPELSANRLMDLLLGGPSKQLADGARTQLGAGAQLASNVRIDKAGVAHVDLEDVDITTAAARQGLAAQIVWTLDRDVEQVAITVNGLPLDSTDAGGGPDDRSSAAADAPGTVYSLNSGNVINFDPDQIPGSAQAVSDAYYISDGAILRLSDSTPMWGKVGTGSVRVVSAALSAASGALAAVTASPDGGQQLLVGRPFDHQPAVPALKATTLTKPSFTRWGYAAWTVQNGAKQPEIYQVSITTGTPTRSRVAAPGLAGKGPVTALELSPDGVRVAIVAGGTLYLGVVSPVPNDNAGDSTSSSASATGSADHRGLQVTGLHVLRGDLTDVGPVTWDDATSLLVGAKSGSSSQYRSLFDVSVDGQSADPVTALMSSGPVFGDVDAIASSSSDLPMLISFGGHIWELEGTDATGRWKSPNLNWLQGTDPFYPN